MRTTAAAQNDDWSALRQAADRLEDAGLPDDTCAQPRTAPDEGGSSPSGEPSS